MNVMNCHPFAKPFPIYFYFVLSLSNITDIPISEEVLRFGYFIIMVVSKITFSCSF